MKSIIILIALLLYFLTTGLLTISIVGAIFVTSNDEWLELGDSLINKL